MGGRAGRKAPAGVSEAEAQQLQKDWSQRETVSAEVLERALLHVVKRFHSKLEKAAPQVAAPLHEALARWEQPGVMEEDRQFLAFLPEPLRYVYFSAASAFLMETDSLVKAIAAMTPEEQARLVMCFEGGPFGGSASSAAPDGASPSSSESGCECWKTVRTVGQHESTCPDGATSEQQFTTPIPPQAMIIGPSFGSAAGAALSLVEYMVKTGPSAGQPRPAAVSRLSLESRTADLVVFFSPADQPHENALQLQAVPFSQAREAGTWYHPSLDGWQADGELASLA